MANMEPDKPEKLPVAANLEDIRARIDIALAKRDAIVQSWVDKYDTSRCAPSKSKEEIEAWDAELFNPLPSNLGLGAAIPKEYLDGDINRKDNAGNSKLRSLMLGKKAGLHAAKPRDAEEKASSMKRALIQDSSDEDGGRSTLGRSKKVKQVVAKSATISKAPKPTNQTETLQSGHKTVTFSNLEAGNLSGDGGSGLVSRASESDSKLKNTLGTETNLLAQDLPTTETTYTTVLNQKSLPVKVEVQTEVTAKPPVPSESVTKPLSEVEARREKNRLKKEKKKERKRKEREQALALAGTGATNNYAREE